MAFITNISGWLFESGLREIHRAYEASRTAFDQEMKDAGDRYEKLKEEGKEDDYSEDEATGQRYYHADHLIDLNYQAEEYLRLLRNAFAIILHHYWEKEVSKWRGGKRYDFKKDYKWLARNTFPINEAGLERLRETANTIKHNVKRLYDIDPNMFDAGEIARAGTDPDWHDALRLEDEHIEEFFAILRKSGPTAASTFDK
jgi:hypothetical protein